MLSAKEVCKELRISIGTLHRYRKQGLLTGFVIGGKKLYFEESELERFLNACKGINNEKTEL
ncbi:MAG: helix-turn-helix domain-containing protein [Patescibacteria group bacterium]